MSGIVVLLPQKRRNYENKKLLSWYGKPFILHVDSDLRMVDRGNVQWEGVCLFIIEEYMSFR